MPNITTPQTNSSVISTLTELGLGENEAILYEILLKTPEATIPDLRAKTQFSRTMLYYILGNLEASELVQTKKHGHKTVYSPAPPEKLEELVAEQEKELGRQKERLDNIMTDLRGSYNLSHNKPGVRYFEGKKEIIMAYEKILDLRQPILSIEDKGNMLDFFPDYVARYVKKRVERQITNRSIAPDTNTINNPDPKKFIDSRLVPANKFPFDMDIKICADTVQFATLKEGQAIAVHITHPIIAKNFRVMFEYMWEESSKLPRYQKNNQQKIVVENNNDGGSSPTVFN